MSVRPFTTADYSMLCRWWTLHKAPAMPQEIFLPADGLVAEKDGVPVAAAFLFIGQGTQGGIGVVEFETTNPETNPFERWRGLREVYQGLEDLAKSKDCGSLMSFVGLQGGQHSVLEKLGWEDVGGQPHLIFGKALCL